MFGISFGELLLVALVALLVLGPERLPGAARTAGLWVGRLKRSFNAIKQEVEREIGADEIRRQLHNEEIMALEQQNKSLLPSAVPASDSLPNPVLAGAPIAAGSPVTSMPISHDSPPPPRAP
jgi:sec-independent protein translocase protein TatB